jgi:hypothetical protein
LHPLLLVLFFVAVSCIPHAPNTFSSILSNWRVQLTSPSYISHEGTVNVKARALFDGIVAAEIPDEWSLSVLYNEHELRRFSSAAVDFRVIVHDQQWVRITVCLLDPTSRILACDYATTLCVPETISTLPFVTTSRQAPIHVGTIGFHALAALPFQVQHVFEVSFHHGFTLVAASCDSLICILSTHSVVSGVWSLHSVNRSSNISDSTVFTPSSLTSFYILESCAIFRFGFSYFRIIVSDFAVDSISPLAHFPSFMHALTCNIKTQCCFFIGTKIEVWAMYYIFVPYVHPFVTKCPRRFYRTLPFAQSVVALIATTVPRHPFILLRHLLPEISN